MQPVLTCATNVANTIAEVYGVTLSGGTIYSDGSDTQTTRPSVEPVPPQKHYSIWESFIGGIFSMLAYIILFIAVFFIFITPLGHSFGWFWGPFGWFGARRWHRGPRPPAALTMTSAPAAVSTAALVDLVLPAGLVLPAAAVSAALAVWGGRLRFWRSRARRRQLRRHGRRQQPRRRSRTRTLMLIR